MTRDEIAAKLAKVEALAVAPGASEGERVAAAGVAAKLRARLGELPRVAPAAPPRVPLPVTLDDARRDPRFRAFCRDRGFELIEARPRAMGDGLYRVVAPDPAERDTAWSGGFRGWGPKL